MAGFGPDGGIFRFSGDSSTAVDEPVPEVALVANGIDFRRRKAQPWGS